MQVFNSHGKLLLTGEYVVLDGARALALPTKFSQILKAEQIPERRILWKSLDCFGRTWLEADFSLDEIKQENTAQLHLEKDAKKRLLQLLRAIQELNAAAFGDSGWNIETSVDFDLSWGLGSSSTLVANLSRVFRVDAFQLLKRTFGGSGYDVAVALQNRPLTYQLHDQKRSVLSTSFKPTFSGSIFFVHLNKKQNSREAISHYRRQDKKQLYDATEKISSLTEQIISCGNLQEFELLLEIHENIISKLIGLPKVKSRLFPDFRGQIKSLGGWGGDFVLATGDESEMEYFKSKGYDTVIPYSEMIL